MRVISVRVTAVALALATGGLTACTAGSGPAPVDTTVVTGTQTMTRPAPVPSFTPSPATTVAGLSPGAAKPAGTKERACPYIASTPEQDSATNVADIIGSHVYRTLVLPSSPAGSPTGCRFYFYAPPYQAIAEIVPQRLTDAATAHDAIVLASRTGTDAQGLPDLVPGVDAVLYRTKFLGADGARDWACAVAAGRTLVLVRTDRDDTSLPARELAHAVAGRFS